MVTPPLPPFARTASPDPSLATPRPYLQGTAVPSRPARAPPRPLVPGSTEVPRPGLPRVLARPGGLFRRPQTRIPPRPSLMDSTGCPPSRAPRRYPHSRDAATPPVPGSPAALDPGLPRGFLQRSPPWPVRPGYPVGPDPGYPLCSPLRTRRASPVAPRPGLPPGPDSRPAPWSPDPGSPAVAPCRAHPSPPLSGSPAALPPGLHRGVMLRAHTWGLGPGNHAWSGDPVYPCPPVPPARGLPRPHPSHDGKAGKRGPHSLPITIQYKSKVKPFERYVALSPEFFQCAWARTTWGAC